MASCHEAAACRRFKISINPKITRKVLTSPVFSVEYIHEDKTVKRKRNWGMKIRCYRLDIRTNRFTIGKLYDCKVSGYLFRMIIFQGELQQERFLLNSCSNVSLGIFDQGKILLEPETLNFAYFRVENGWHSESRWYNDAVLHLETFSGGWKWNVKNCRICSEKSGTPVNFNGISRLFRFVPRVLLLWGNQTERVELFNSSTARDITTISRDLEKVLTNKQTEIQ